LTQNVRGDIQFKTVVSAPKQSSKMMT